MITFVKIKQLYRFVIQDDDGIGADDPLGEVTIPANDLVGEHNLSNPRGGYIIITDTTPTTTTTMAPTTTTPTITTPRPTTTLPPMPTCPQEGVHLYPYPGDCSMYIHCVEGSSSIYRCPLKMLFDSIKKECDDEELALCAETQPPQKN